MMTKTISATQARVPFGEVMRGVVERGDTVIVERSGKPQVVVLAVSEYERLRAGSPQKPHWQQALDDVHELIRRVHGDQEMPDPVELINAGREERDAELLAALR